MRVAPIKITGAGRTHHLRFYDLEMSGDAKPGAIVETRADEDAAGRNRLSLAMTPGGAVDWRFGRNRGIGI